MYVYVAMSYTSNINSTTTIINTIIIINSNER